MLLSQHWSQKSRHAAARYKLGVQPSGINLIIEVADSARKVSNIYV